MYCTVFYEKMKVTEVVLLVALWIALWVPESETVDTTDVANEATGRRLRSTDASSPFGAMVGWINPLQRREVSSHRVYDPLSGLACWLVGSCVACSNSEKNESYCRETGYRQELECPRPRDPKDAKPHKERQTRYTPCSTEQAARPGLAVVKFEVVMTLTLALSIALLRRERRNYMSSFDLNMEPRQRAGLLGGAATTIKGSD